MSKTVSLWGATYNNVPAIEVPSGNGTALFYDVSGSQTITQNGTYDVTDKAEVVVNVSSGGTVVVTDTQDSHGGIIREITATQISLQPSKTVSPSTSQQTVNPDTGYDAMESVIVNAMPSGTAGTPTATKGSVSNHQVSVTPSVTNTTGYISGSTKTGTAVTVSASELVSGTLSITANGTHDVTNYASVNVNVSGGSSKNAQSHLSTTRATSASYTNCNSLTCTKAGTYTVYWSCMRSSTGGTNGSQLYIGGTEYGTADTTTWSNHVQNKELTGVQINANQTVAVYARSRGSNYYAYVPLLTIIEE